MPLSPGLSDVIIFTVKSAKQRMFTPGSYVAGLIGVVAVVFWLDSYDSSRIWRFGHDPYVARIVFSHEGEFGLGQQSVPRVADPRMKLAMPEFGSLTVYYDGRRVVWIEQRLKFWWQNRYPHDRLLFKYGTFGGGTASVRGVTIVSQQQIVAVPYLPIVAVCGFIALIVPILRVIRDELRSKIVTTCPNCGYDLRATPQRCPECGLVPASF